MRRRTGRAGALAIAGALLVSSILSGSAAEPQPVRLRVSVEAGAEGRDRIAARGLDVAGHDLPAGRIELIVTPEEAAWLLRAGFRFELLERRVGRRPLAGGATDVPLPDTRYTDPAELETYLQQVAASYPSITRLVALGTSTEGRTVWGLLISDNAAIDEDELAVLFNAAHHAREVMTPEVVIDTIDVLTQNYGLDPDVTRWVDTLAIWCVPMVNPDGVAVVHEEDDFWRKNTRDNNSNGLHRDFQDGVDLNRNYEWGWGYQCRGSSGSWSASTYRGPAEGSEPESQALAALGRRIRPVFDVEYHAYGEDVFYALSCDPAYSPTLSTIAGADQSISRVIAEDYAARIVQADGQVGFTPAPYGSRVDGTGRDQQYHESGAIAFVTEVNNAAEGGFHPDYGTYRDPTVQGQRPGWQFLLDRVTGPAIGGHVTDQATGAPLEAEIALDELRLPDGRRIASRADTGRFHLIVVPGDYTLRVSRPGYVTAVVPVTVGAGFVPTEVALLPDGATELVRETFEDPASAALWSAGAPGDTATGGLWVWGEPVGTHRGDADGVTGLLEFGNPRFDATPGEGRFAFVTGNGAAGTNFAGDDVDGGTTSLVSPPYDLSGRYGVTVRWLRWFRKDAADPGDALVAEVSVDGGASFVPLASDTATAGTADAAPAWAPVAVRLDELVPIGPDVRLRFRASDDGPDDVVEAAIDDLTITGFALAEQGEVRNLAVSGAASTVLSWDAVPGGEGAVYDAVRGELANLAAGAGGVDLGPLTCVEDDSTDLSTANAPDTERPAAGTGRFYLVRFRLGFSLGGYGAGSDGSPRAGSGGCP